MNDAKYIGLNVHQATISAAVLDSAGSLVMEAILETKAETSGCALLLRSYNRDIVLPLTSRKSLALARAHLSSLFIAATTLTAGVILVIVVLHVLAN